MARKNNKDVYCLFHEMKNCGCETPIKDTKTLRKRLVTCIKVNEGLQEIEFDETKLIQAEKRIMQFQKRIDALKAD